MDRIGNQIDERESVKRNVEAQEQRGVTIESKDSCLNITIVPSGLKAGKLRWLSICTKLGSSPKTDPEMECVCFQDVVKG